MIEVDELTANASGFNKMQTTQKQGTQTSSSSCKLHTVHVWPFVTNCIAQTHDVVDLDPTNEAILSITITHDRSNNTYVIHLSNVPFDLRAT